MAVSAGKTSLKYVDSCLVALKNKATSEVVLDEEKTKILSDFYRKIK